MSDDDGRQFRTPEEAVSEPERTEPLSGALAGLAVLVQQQQQQQHLQALMQHARNMQQANMILQLNAQLQQQQLAQSGLALPSSPLALSLASTAASNLNVQGQINLSTAPQANVLPAALANQTPNAETSLQGAVAMLASAANLQHILAQLQHQSNQNHQSQASQYMRLDIPSTTLGGLGIPSPFSIMQQRIGGFPISDNPTGPPDSSRLGSATGSLSLGSTSSSAPAVTAAMTNQLPTILSMLQYQQAAASAPIPTSTTSGQRAPDVPSSIHSIAMAANSGIVQQVSQGEVTMTASSVGPLTIQSPQNVSNLSSITVGEASSPALTNRPPIALHLEEDSHSLNAYQCLLRKQIELFETAPTSGVEGRSQGRNTPIRIGQVGIRCRHCSTLPNKARPKGAVYYSKSLDGVYQVSQNMSKVHLTERCRRIPNNIKQRLISLHSVNRRASGGKPYWVDGLRRLGVYEDGPILRFLPEIPRHHENTGSDDNNDKKRINR